MRDDELPLTLTMPGLLAAPRGSDWMVNLNIEASRAVKSESASEIRGVLRTVVYELGRAARFIEATPSHLLLEAPRLMDMVFRHSLELNDLKGLADALTDWYMVSVAVEASGNGVDYQDAVRDHLRFWSMSPSGDFQYQARIVDSLKNLLIPHEQELVERRERDVDAREKELAAREQALIAKERDLVAREQELDAEVPRFVWPGTTLEFGIVFCALYVYLMKDDENPDAKQESRPTKRDFVTRMASQFALRDGDNLNDIKVKSAVTNGSSSRFVGPDGKGRAVIEDVFRQRTRGRGRFRDGG